MNRLLEIVLLLMVLCSPVWGGVDFDGADDYITTGGGASVKTSFDSGGTFSAWVSVASDGDANEGFIFSANNKGFEVRTVEEAAGEVKIQFLRWFTGADGKWTTTSTEVTLDTWTHVLITYDGSATTNDPVIYIDGTSKSITEDVTPTGTVDLTGDAGVVFGDNVGGGGVRSYDGSISELAVWSAELTAIEIALLASARVKRMPLQIQSANLIGYWPLDDGSDGTASCFNGVAGFEDLSSNAKDGTGNDGANNTGLTCLAEAVLSYPPDAIAVTKDAAAAEGGGGNVIPSGIVAEGIVIGKAKLKGSDDGG